MPETAWWFNESLIVRMKSKVEDDCDRATQLYHIWRICIPYVHERLLWSLEENIHAYSLALYYMIVFVFLGKPRTADRVVSCMDFTTLPHGLNHILTKAFNVFVGCWKYKSHEMVKLLACSLHAKQGQTNTEIVHLPCKHFCMAHACFWQGSFCGIVF